MGLAELLTEEPDTLLGECRIMVYSMLSGWKALARCYRSKQSKAMHICAFLMLNLIKNEIGEPLSGRHQEVILKEPNRWPYWSKHTDLSWPSLAFHIIRLGKGAASINIGIM